MQRSCKNLWFVFAMEDIALPGNARNSALGNFDTRDRGRISFPMLSINFGTSGPNVSATTCGSNLRNTCSMFNNWVMTISTIV